MREWLTVIVALLILAVVLDGIRRMRQTRRSGIRMPRTALRRANSEGAGSEADNSYGSELPNGGARVVNVRKPDDARQLYRKMRQTREEKTRQLGKPQRIPQQVALNLDEHVPTLMEVEESTRSPASRSAQEQPSSQSRRGDAQDEMAESFGAADEGNRIEPQLSDEPLELDAEPRGWSEADEDAEQWDDDEFFAPAGDDDSDLEDEAIEPDEEVVEDDFREPEEVLVINVMAPKGEHFLGDALLQTVLQRGMRFGSMNIFHHHERADGKGAILYSMANIVVPGTFDLATMRDFSTPGVSLFLALPLEADSSAAFEAMLTTAKAIANDLGGDMKDENRSIMTAQTIEHYRTRIKEFERKQLSRAPV